MILSRHRKRDDRGSKAQNATARPAPGAAQEPRRGDAPRGILERHDARGVVGAAPGTGARYHLTIVRVDASPSPSTRV